jgi:hypothetical protein
MAAMGGEGYSRSQWNDRFGSDSVLPKAIP